MKLDKTYWNNRYKENEIGWDIGTISPPLKAYFNQLANKELKIIIPGCGNAYEAEYLVENGFKNVFLVDVSPLALESFSQRVPHFPKENLICDDFEEIKSFIDTKYLKFNQTVRKQAAQKFITCRNCKFSGLLCNPCPLANKFKIVKECEWVTRQEILLQDKILKSKLKCLIQPKNISQNRLIFYVKTQNKPLFLEISLSKFNKFFQAKNVKEIVSWFKETSATEKIVRFVCQLRSHGIIEIEKFRLPIFDQAVNLKYY